MQNNQSTRHVLEGRELIDYLVENTSNTANAELLRREERRNRRLTVILSILTVVGVGGLVGALKMFVNEQMVAVREQADDISGDIEAYVDHQTNLLLEDMSGRIEAKVNAKVEEEVGQVRNMLLQYKQYQEFLALSEVIKAEVENDKFPDKALETSLNLVEQLAQAESITGQPRFLEAVKIVIDLLVRTDRKSDIDKLEAALSHVFITDSTISLDLADHYGQVIISSPYPVDELQHEYEALCRYARASRELNYPEKALMWELFVAYKRTEYVRSPTTDSMVEMIQDLNEADTRNFCYQIFLNSHPLHWMNTPDQEGRELARLVNQLLEDYSNLRQTVENQMATPELQPAIEKLIARKMERLQQLPPQQELQQLPPQQEQEDEMSQTAERRNNDNTLRR